MKWKKRGEQGEDTHTHTHIKKRLCSDEEQVYIGRLLEGKSKHEESGGR